MSILKTINDSLIFNPDVDIIGGFVLFSDFHNKPALEHFVDLYVAPTKGIYDVKALQKFMMGLVPEGLTPTSVTDFRKSANNYIKLGSLHFKENTDEAKGNRERTMLKSSLTIVDSIVDEDYFTDISLNVLPCKRTAEDFLKYRLRFDNSITAKEFLKYKNSPAASLGYDAGKNLQ